MTRIRTLDLLQWELFWHRYGSIPVSCGNCFAKHAPSRNLLSLIIIIYIYYMTSLWSLSYVNRVTLVWNPCQINILCMLERRAMGNQLVGKVTIVTFKRYLIIDDKSLPHKQRRAFTRLLIFNIKFSRQAPSRWLAGSAEMTPVIGNAQRVRREVTLTIELID